MTKALVSPFFLALLCLLLGQTILFLSWSRLEGKARFALLLTAAAALILLVFGLPVVPRQLAIHLEREYLRPTEAALQNLDVVVILSGGYRKGPRPDDDELTWDTYSRTGCGVQAFLRSNARWLIMSGSSYERGNGRDGELMREVARKMGVRSERVVIEPYSRSTFEHPRGLARLKELRAEDRIGIATSAWHIPRAMQELRRQFKTVMAIPCSPVGVPAAYNVFFFVPRVEALNLSTVLLQEYVGALWYRFRHIFERE